MPHILRGRPSPATGIALVALFIALGGTSYAQLFPQRPAQAVPTSTAGFSSFKDSFQLNSGANQMVTVARLNVPAGRYVVTAKLYVDVPQNGLTDTVRCDLVAGGTGPGGDFDRTIVTHDATVAFASVALNVVHTFTTAAVINLSCGHMFAAGNAPLGFIKISAIRVASLSNARST